MEERLHNRRAELDDVAIQKVISPPVIKPEEELQPPACRHSNMALSIVPTVILLSASLIFAFSTTVMVMFSIVCFGWLPVLLGMAKRVLGAFKHDTAVQKPNTLPEIVILLPLYEEANMLEQINQMLRRLDYPADKLDCMILLETDDTNTIIAAIRIEWPRFARIVTVPNGQPKTKARASNYGLERSTAEIVVIFDAEDRPHAQQLREAAARFTASDNSLACLQAPLVIAPEENSWLQAQFALEYSVLFMFILPNLSAAMSCLPLGGSSNYFRRAALERVGGWDDWNLTEDADLALRLAGYGYRIET